MPGPMQSTETAVSKAESHRPMVSFREFPLSLRSTVIRNGNNTVSEKVHIEHKGGLRGEKLGVDQVRKTPLPPRGSETAVTNRPAWPGFPQLVHRTSGGTTNMFRFKGHLAPPVLFFFFF